MRRPTLLTKRAACAYIHDLTMVAVGFVAAMYLRVGSLLFGPYLDATLASLPLILGIGAVTLPALRLYRGIWRYASINDLIQLTKAVTAVIVVFLLVLFLVNRLDPIPRSVPVIQWFITLVLMGATRFAYRLRKDRRLALSLTATGEKRTPIILVGTSDATDLFLRSLAKTRSCPYRAVGIIAVKPAHVGRTLQGVPVIASLDDLEQAIEKLQRDGDRPHRVVVAQDDAKIRGAAMRQLVETCGRLGLPISRMSRPTEFKEMARSGHIELQPIAIEDLLGRPQMALDLTAIRELVAGRRVLVTGAGGTIGSELSRQIAALAPDRLVLLDNCEFNLYAIDLELQQTHPATPLSTVYETVREAVRISGQASGDTPLLLIALGDTGPSERFGSAELRFVPYEENPEMVAAYYQAADLYLHGAKADNLPTTIVEALASAVPVIATAVGGIPEQVRSLAGAPGGWAGPAVPRDQATGVLVQAGDAAGMAAAALALLADDDLRACLSANAARDAAERFDLRDQVENTVAWYQELLRGQARDSATPPSHGRPTAP